MRATLEDASLLFAAGRNVKQVQAWLGHADPGFTLRTYVHLMDAGVGEADFLDDAVGSEPTRVNSGSTRRTKRPQIRLRRIQRKPAISRRIA